MSIHEEATYSVDRADDGRLQQPRAVTTSTCRRTASTIDRARSGESWSWSEDGKELTFKLRQGVKWHDGKPFTAADVKCTWDLLPGKAKEKLRGNPRKAWYDNLDEVATNGDYEATFHLKRPQPALPGAARLGLFAGLSLPRVAGADAAAPDRHRPVQVRRVQAERAHQGRARTRITGSRAGPISTASNTRSCRTARPRSSALSPGKFDMTLPYSVTLPLLQRHQEPGAASGLRADDAATAPTNLLVNRDKPPFDNAESAQGAGAGARPQGLHRHHDRGAGQDRRRRCCRRPKGSGACRRRCCRRSPAMVPMSRRTAPKRARSWKSSATGRTSGSRSRSRPATSPTFRDPAVILIDQLKEIYIDGVLETDRDRQLALQGDAQGLHDRR